jgi:hypothetical protein
MRCDHCRKSFGLILHRYFRMRFCSADCLKAYQRRLDELTMMKIHHIEPLYSGNLRLADRKALTASIHCILQSAYDVALGNLLARAIGLQAQHELHGFWKLKFAPCTSKIFVMSLPPFRCQLVPRDRVTQVPIHHLAKRDATGKVFGQDLYAAAKDGQITEVSYMFPKPGTDMTPVAKVSLVTRIGDLGCGVGYYK